MTSLHLTKWERGRGKAAAATTERSSRNSRVSLRIGQDSYFRARALTANA